MNLEKEFEYAKQLAEFLPQNSEKYIYEKDGRIYEDYIFDIVNEYRIDLSYSLFSIEELLKFLPTFIFSDIEYHLNFGVKKLGDHYICYKGYYFDLEKKVFIEEIAESFKECIIKALIELNKVGLIKI